MKHSIDRRRLRQKRRRLARQRRRKAQTRTKRLTEEQAKLCQEWVRDHKALKRIVRQMERVSLAETDRTLGEISKA